MQVHKMSSELDFMVDSSCVLSVHFVQAIFQMYEDTDQSRHDAWTGPALLQFCRELLSIDMTVVANCSASPLDKSEIPRYSDLLLLMLQPDRYV